MEPFIGQIQAFGFNFAPRGWAKCDGQLMPISGNEALFSLLGTIYGGDGRTTFALPDLRGRVPINHGRGPGLHHHHMGAKGGTENVTLTIAEIPNHNHNMQAVRASDATIGTKYSVVPDTYQPSDETPNVGLLGTNTTINTGGGQSHTNMQPYLAINYCIALVGVYPPRS